MHNLRQEMDLIRPLSLPGRVKILGGTWRRIEELDDMVVLWPALAMSDPSAGRIKILGGSWPLIQDLGSCRLGSCTFEVRPQPSDSRPCAFGRLEHHDLILANPKVEIVVELSNNPRRTDIK